MENKKLSKKLSTIFWWVLYCMPLIIFFINFFGYFRAFEGLGTIEFLETSLFEIAGNQSYLPFTEDLWVPLRDAFISIFSAIGLNPMGGSTFALIVIFSWFITVHLLHIIVDTILFLPRLFHNFIERWS